MTDYLHTCDCCDMAHASVKKYKGLGYYCRDCMEDGCMSDDLDAQNPSGSGPYFLRQPVVHARLRGDGHAEAEARP